MFRECRSVAQVAGEPHRRWFIDEGFDLLVWLDRADEPVGFELIYEREEGRCVLARHPGRGLVHSRVDEGRHGVMGHPQTLLVATAPHWSPGTWCPRSAKANRRSAPPS